MFMRRNSGVIPRSRPVSHRSAAHAEPERNPWVILIVLCTAVFMLLLDTTIVNNAQVKIREGLNANLTEIQWVLDSYILTYAVLLLSLGRLGDVFGRKRLFLLGMALFTLASGFCGISSWLGGQIGVSGVNMLIASRVLQGIGGAMMMPQSLSLLTVNFPPEKRGTAMGIWGSIVGLGAVAGPLIGGYLVTHYAWEWVFLINLPVGAGALIAAARIIPESTDPSATRKLDWTGLALSGIGIFLFVYGIIEGNLKGWSNPQIYGSISLGLILTVVFVWWELHVPDPMMKVELFRIRNFSIGNIVALAVSFGMLGLFFPMTIYMQGILGYSAIKAGLAMSPMSITILFAAPFSGRLSDRIGTRWILFGGLLTQVVGIFYIIRQSTLGATPWTLLPALVLTGLGMGFTFAPMTAAVMRDVPPRIAGSASGILNTMRNIGQVLGIAVLGSVLQNRVSAHVGNRLEPVVADPGTRGQIVEYAQQSQFERIAALAPAGQINAVFDAVRHGFTDSIHNTFFVGALICLIAAGVAWFLRDPVQARAEARDETASPAAAVAD
jgi:EmrB/QacA subfamily drug resistance transporter